FRGGRIVDRRRLQDRPRDGVRRSRGVQEASGIVRLCHRAGDWATSYRRHRASVKKKNVRDLPRPDFQQIFALHFWHRIRSNRGRSRVGMAESFLKEQLERIKKLTERISAVEGQRERLADEIAHDREAMHRTPLHEVRDYRPYP